MPVGWFMVPGRMSNAAHKHTPESHGGKRGPTQTAAKLAADHVPECVQTLVAVLRQPSRGSQAQLMAAKMLLELAGELEPEAPSGAPVRLVDARQAAEVLRNRLKEGGQ